MAISDEALIAALSRGLGAEQPQPQSDSIAGPLRECVASAQSEWPNLRVDLLGFVEHVAERLPGYRPVAQELASVSAGDLLLAYGCTRGDAAAVGAFEQGFLPLVDAAGRKLRMDDTALDELRQRVRMRLLVGKGGDLPKISTYAGTGALKSWVYATALRTGLNQLRGKTPSADDQLLVALPDSEDDPQLRYMKQLYRDAFRSALRQALTTVPDRESNVLRHYYVDDMTLAQIGSLYRVHKTTVMRWLNRAHAHLENETKRLMTQNLDLGEQEVESVLRLIRSGIQVSLSSYLVRVD